MKKILSIILSLILALSAIPLSAFAESVQLDYSAFYNNAVASAEGVLYLLNGSEATAIGIEEGGTVDGILALPEEILYRGEKYAVTALSSKTVGSSDSWAEFNSETLKYNTSLYENCSKIILPDSVKYLDLEIFGTREKPIDIELGKNIETVKKTRPSYYKEGVHNIFEYITLNTTRSDRFKIENNLLIKDGREVIAPMGGFSSYTIGAEIEEIADYAFNNSENIEEITFDKRESDIHIGRYAFKQCNSIESIYIPAYLSSDSYYAFADMEGLARAKFASRFFSEKIPKGLLSSCESIRTLKIPSSVETIGISAFSFCTSLYKIELPSTLKTLKGGAFNRCDSLQKISLPSVTYIGQSCFYGCDSLSKVTLYKSTPLKTIAMFAFKDCIRLKKLTLPNSLKKIGSSAFEGSGIRSFTPPKGVKTIEEDLFRDSNLEKVKLHSGIKLVRTRAFFDCQNLKEITFPKKTKFHEWDYVGRCKNLKKLTFNCELSHFRYFLYSSKKVVEVNFNAKGLEKIYAGEFENCKKLKKVKISNKKYAPEIEKNAFKGARKGIKFYVKNKTVAKKLLKNLKKSGYKSAKIYIGKKRYK